MTRKQDTIAFAERIKALGFTVYIAERGTYGFITDQTASRVLTFSMEDGGNLGGSYGPPSRESGTGWRMDIAPHHLNTADDVKQALYANPPEWLRGKGWRYLSTVAQYLAIYGSSSRFDLA